MQILNKNVTVSWHVIGEVKAVGKRYRASL